MEKFRNTYLKIYDRDNADLNLAQKLPPISALKVAQD